MREHDITGGAGETVQVPGRTPGAAAKAVLSVAAAAPGYRVERADDGYLLTHRARPAWATVAGWATVPLLIGIGILFVRKTSVGRVTVAAAGELTVLHLRGTFRDDLLRGLRALSDGPPVPARAPLPQQILQPLGTPQSPPPGSVPGGAPDAPAAPQPAAVPGGDARWEPPKAPVPSQPSRAGHDYLTPNPDEQPPAPATDIWATSAPIEATVRRNPARPFAPQAPATEPPAGPHVVHLDTGERFEVGAFELFGRDPAAVAGETVTRLVKVADERRGVSKTHLAVGADTGGVWVSDRHSTNGTVVQRTDGQVSPCQPGERVYLRPGDIVWFGDRRLHLTQP